MRDTVARKGEDCPEDGDVEGVGKKYGRNERWRSTYEKDTGKEERRRGINTQKKTV
jgi:hypothetical protein